MGEPTLGQLAASIAALTTSVEAISKTLGTQAEQLKQLKPPAPAARAESDRNPLRGTLLLPEGWTHFEKWAEFAQLDGGLQLRRNIADDLAANKVPLATVEALSNSFHTVVLLHLPVAGASPSAQALLSWEHFRNDLFMIREKWRLSGDKASAMDKEYLGRLKRTLGGTGLSQDLTEAVLKASTARGASSHPPPDGAAA